MKAFQKWTALAVLAAMLVLAACGGGGEASGETASLAGETVYAASFQPVRDNTEAALTPLLYTEEGLYVSSYEWMEENALREDAPAYETRILFVPYGGEAEALDYTPIEGPAPAAEGGTVTDSGAEIAALFREEDGTFLALERCYAAVYAGPEELTEDSGDYWQYVTTEESWSLRRLGADFSASGAVSLEAPAGGRFEPDRAVLDGEGNLALAYSGEDGSGVLVLSPEGQELRRVETESAPVGLIRLADGRAAMLVWSRNSLAVQTLDGTGSWPISSDAWSAVSGAGDWDLYYTKGTHLYGYDLEAGQEEPLLDWIVCGVDSGSLYGLNVSPEGTVRALVNTRTGEENGRVTAELVTLEKKSAAALPEKTVLTLAGQYTSSSLREAVLDFNRRSQTARIEIRDYSELNTDTDYYAGVNRLTTEILAGQMPDLFITEDLPYAQLAAKGLLEDLYPWLDRDGELNREDLFANVLRALEVDGGLYQVNSGFSIATAAGDRALVGDGGLTYERAEELLAAMPEGSTLMGMSGIREDVFFTCLALELDRLVDWKTGECRFDGEDFIRMLEFIKTCPSQEEADSGPREEPERELLAQGRQLLYVSGIAGFQDIQLIESCFPGREVAYPGFPTGDGNRGSALFLYGGLAMSSTCADKEAAWDFLRTFLLPRSGRGDNGLPLNKAAFEKSLQDACTPVYQKDAQGHVLLDEKGEPIEQSRGSMVSDDGSSQNFYALTEKQAETVRSLAESVDTLVEINQGLMEIVFNESQAFFNGQKTAQETAKLIQSKAGIYLSEHS